MASQNTPSKLTTWIRKSFRSRSRSPRSRKNLNRVMEMQKIGTNQNCGSKGCISKSADDSVNRPYSKKDSVTERDSCAKKQRSVSSTRGTSTERPGKNIQTQPNKQTSQTQGSQGSAIKPRQDSSPHAKQPCQPSNRPNYCRHRSSPSKNPEGPNAKIAASKTNMEKQGDYQMLGQPVTITQVTQPETDSSNTGSITGTSAGQPRLDNSCDTLHHNGPAGSGPNDKQHKSRYDQQQQSATAKFTSRLTSMTQVLPSKPQHPNTCSSNPNTNTSSASISNMAGVDGGTPAVSISQVAMATNRGSDVKQRSQRGGGSPSRMTHTDTTQQHNTQTSTQTQVLRHPMGRQSRTPTAMGHPQRISACSPDSAVHSPGSLNSPSDTSFTSDSKPFHDVQKKMQKIKSDLKRHFLSTGQGLSDLMDIKDTYADPRSQSLDRQTVSGSSLNSRSGTPLVQDCFTRQQIYNAYKMHKSEGQQDTKIDMCPKQLQHLEQLDMYSYTGTTDTEVADFNLRPRSRSSQSSSRRSKSAGTRDRRRQQSVSPHRRSLSQERCSLASSNSESRRSLRIAKTEQLNERNARRSRSQQSIRILRDLPGFIPSKRSESLASSKMFVDDDEDEGCSSDSSLSFASTCSSEDECDYDDIESGFHPVIQRLQHPYSRSRSHSLSRSRSHSRSHDRSMSSLSQYSIYSTAKDSYQRYPTPTVEPAVCEVHGPVTLNHPLSPITPRGPYAPISTLSPSPQGQKGTKDFLMDRWWSTLRDVTNVAEQGSRAVEEEEDQEDEDDSTCKDDLQSEVSMATTASYIPGVTLADKLRLAASKGQMDKVKELICNGATFEPDREGRTALHYAALNGYAEVVQMLAVEGSSIDSQDNLGYTALHRAAAQGHLDVIKVLLAEGCMIDRQDEVHHNTALHEAAWNGLSKSLEFLIKSNADVNIVNKAGFTALHLCCQNGHNQSARVLLYGGAGTSLKNNYGDTPLHTAARYGHAGVTRILLSAKCDGNEQNKNGDTCLHISAALKRRKIAKLLVDAFVNVNIKNKQNETAIDVARRKDHPEIIEIILSQPKPPKTKKNKKSKDGEKKDKKGFLFWKKKEKEKAVEAAQYAVPPKSQGVRSIAPSIAAPSEISSCRQLDQFPGYKQSMQSIPSQVRTAKSTRGVGTTAGSQLSLSSKQGYLSQYTAQEGVQYYKDLAGNVKQGPIGFAPVCNCGPLIKRLEQKVDADKANFYDHVDATRRMLTDRMKTVTQSLEQASCDRMQNEKRERDDAIHRRAVKERMELEKHLDRQHNALRNEMKDYVDAKLNNIVSQDDCCNWHHSACKNYHGMRRMPRESTPKTNLYRSKSDETLSSLGLSQQDTHRVSRTQAQHMRELKKKSQLKENREPPSHRVPSYPPPRDLFKMHGRSPEGSSSQGDLEDETPPVMPAWARPDNGPYRPHRQPMVSPLASVPETSNTFSDSSLQPHQLDGCTDDSLVAPFSSPVYQSMEIVPSNMKVYHSKTDSGSNPDSGYSNSSRGARQHAVDDQHNTSSMTNESCTTDGSGSSLRSSMSADKSADQPLPSSRQYFNTVSNQMEMWYERRLREMEKTADDHTRQQSDAMQSQMKHIEERIAINRLRMNPSLESTTGTEV